MAKIEKLTRGREQAALAALSEAASRREDAANAVAELLACKHEAASIAEAEHISKWLVWKQEELKSRNIKLAAAKATYMKMVRHAGRHIAEHAVLTELYSKARLDNKRTRETHAASITFPDGQSR